MRKKPREEGLWFEIPGRTEEEELEEEKRHSNAPKISEEEVECFHDLLSKVFKYQPEERIFAEEFSRHEWFVKDFAYARKTS